MVIERVITIYVCEFCQKQYTDMFEAEECEKICRRFADSPGIEKLKLSPRAFNALYYAKINTIGELVQLSEKELSKIKGLGQASLRKVKGKLKNCIPPKVIQFVEIELHNSDFKTHTRTGVPFIPFSW